MSIYHSHQLAFAGSLPQNELSNWQSIDKFPSWFRTIPPERVGLDGKFDYHGLQKRVEAAFRECFEPQDLAQLFVAQRGRVVVLYGYVPSEEMLNRLVMLAKRVNGTTRVEVAGVNFENETSVVTVGGV